MIQNNEFMTDNQGSIFKKSNASFTRQSVIKKDEVRLGNSKRIEPKVHQPNADHDGQVFPITEDGQVVGFVYECSCGEVAKIMFEFEEAVNRAAV